MNRRIAKGIVIGVAALTLAGAVTACSSGSDGTQYDFLVTYNYNVSHLLDSVSCPTQYLGLKLGSDGESPLAFAPGDPKLGTGFVLGVLEHSYIEGWYQAKCNEEGAPLDVDGDLFRQDTKGNAIKADADGYLLDAEGEYLVTDGGEKLFLSEYGMLFSEKKNTPLSMTSRGQVTSSDGKKSILTQDGETMTVTRVEVQLDREKKWNFENDRVTENVTLYAHFIDTPRILVLDEDDNEVAFYDGVPGDAVRAPLSSRYPRKTGYTFYGFYTDKTFGTPFKDEDWEKLTYPSVEDIQDDQFPTQTVYAKFIDGIWSIVRNESQLLSALNGTTNVWLDTDLTFGDGENGTTIFPAGNTYGGEFNGNDHIISGIVVEMSGSRNTANNTGFGLFGTLLSTANIHNVTIVDAQFTLSRTISTVSSYYAGLLAGVAEAGAQITKVTISGTITIGSIAQPQLFACGKLIGKDNGAVISETPDTDIVLVGDPNATNDD